MQLKFFMTKQTFLSVLLLLAGISTFAQGYNIEVQVKGISDTTLILGHHFNDKLFPDDTITVNKHGKGTFASDSLLKGGMYLVLTPAHGYFDILVDKDQQFKLTTDTADMVGHMVVEGSTDNALFIGYQQFMIQKRRESEALIKEKETASAKRKKEIDKALQQISDEVMAYRDNIIDENPNTFVADFLLATKEIDVPEPPRDADGNITDSTFQYRYYKKHYFDHFDPADARLLRTPLYEKKIMTYMEKVVPQIPDSIIAAADMLIEKSRSDKELFRYMLITLFNHYAKSKIMGMDAVYLHIADKYYIPEATWSDEEFIAKLKETVAKNKHLTLGQKAPNVQLFEVPFQHFIEAENDTALKRNPHIGAFTNLHDYQGRFTVLVFWEADCGHCKKVVPQIHKVYMDTLQSLNTQVLAVHTLGGVAGKEKWVNFVNKHELYDWVNCWNPYSYDYKVKFNVESTPSVFVLDKNKKIIAKKIGPEQLTDFISNYAKTTK